MRIYLNIILTFCLLISTTVLATPQETKEHKSQPPKNDYNIVMIVLDSCRPDHLGCYAPMPSDTERPESAGHRGGYPKNTSPNIDKIAKESIVFDRAIAQSDHTLPSFGSFLTSKYPAAQIPIERIGNHPA